jgi:hypothetical protein
MMSELWELVWGKPQVDPTALAAAIERELQGETVDFRTRLLVRDSTEALEHYWGKARLREWLRQSPVGDKIEAIKKEDLGKPGFSALKSQLMDRTEPETVTEYLRELGHYLTSPVTLEIGGSIALIITGHLSRATTDIDLVNEVPDVLRNDHKLLERLHQRYGLMLTHFQSHYLPSGWEDRLHEVGTFGKIVAYVVDACDIFIGKLFSTRDKDLDDLRAMKSRMKKDLLEKRLRSSASQLMQEPALLKSAEKNWYILFGEELPRH